MNRSCRLVLLALLLLFLAMPRFASAQVHDEANIFSQAARDKAEAKMNDISYQHHKQFVVETIAAVPADQQDQLKQDGPDQFFRKLMAERANALRVNGVFALVCMNPHYVAVGAGRQTTERGDFTEADRDRLRNDLRSDFHNGHYDQGLLNAADEVDQDFSRNIHDSKASSNSGYPAPAFYPPNTHRYQSQSTGLGTILCFVVGLLVIISLIRSIFYRGGGGFGGGYGGGYGPGPGYGPGYGAGYGPGYGGYGGGSGFGRGFLGGLLGGALGGYAENRLFGGGNQNIGNFGGGGFGGSTGGGDPGFQPPSSSFDSGPSDAGQGFGDNFSGGDFSGGGGGGGDSSGGGF